LKCYGTRAKTRFRLWAKRTSPFKSAGASVQSTTGRRAVHISLQGLYCSCKPLFCSHVTLTGYPLHFLVSPSPLLSCVTVCHHISTGLLLMFRRTLLSPFLGSKKPRKQNSSQTSIAPYQMIGLASKETVDSVARSEISVALLMNMLVF
jgi:hypothetical protein